MNSDKKNPAKPAHIADAKPAIDAKDGAANANGKETKAPASHPGSPTIDIKTPVLADAHPLNAEMRSRWTKFADGDLKGVKSREELSTAVASKYGISEALAATQVTEWAVGRQF